VPVAEIRRFLRKPMLRCTKMGQVQQIELLK
jgi:hypothetical protein